MYKNFMGEKPVTNHLILLDPKLFGRLSKKGVMNTVNVYTALPRILELIQMRHSMTSILTTVKGTTIRIGDTIRVRVGVRVKALPFACPAINGSTK